MGLLDLLLGQGGNVAGGPTPNYTQNQGTIQGDPGMSPLARSLLAGYFAGIGSPKLAGWSGAVSRGGTAALNEYDEQQQANFRNKIYQQNQDAETARSGLYQKQLDLQNKKMEHEYGPQTWVNVNTHQSVKSESWPGEGWVDYEAYAKNYLLNQKPAPQSAGDKERERLDAKREAQGANAIGDNKSFAFLDPQTLQPLEDQNISEDQAKAAGAKKVTRKDAESIKGYQDALEAINRLRVNSKNIYPKEADLGITGTLGSSAAIQADEYFHPSNYSEYKADQAMLTGVPRITLGGNRMNLTEWNGVMDKISGGRNYKATQESVEQGLDEMEAMLKKRLAPYSKAYAQGSGASGSFADDSAPPTAPTQSTTPSGTLTPNFIPGTKAVRLNN